MEILRKGCREEREREEEKKGRRESIHYNIHKVQHGAQSTLSVP